MFRVKLAFHWYDKTTIVCVVRPLGPLFCLFLPLRIVLIEWLCCFNPVCHSEVNPLRDCVLWSLVCLLRTCNENRSLG